MRKNKISKITIISLHLMCGLSFGNSLNYVTNRIEKYLWPNKASKEEQIVRLIDKFLSDESILNLEPNLISSVLPASGNEVFTNKLFTDKAIRAKYHESVEKLQVLLSQVDKIIIKDRIIDRFINRNLDGYQVQLKVEAFLQPKSKNKELLAAYKALLLAKKSCGADLKNKNNQVSAIQFFRRNSGSIKVYNQKRNVPCNKHLYEHSMNIFTALAQLKEGLSCDQTS